MAANSVLTHRNVGVLTVASVAAPEVVTSAWIDEQLAETYKRTGLSAGILTDLAGIEERRWWAEGVTFDQAAAKAGRKALDESGIDPDGVGMLISTSVCKHHLEPSVACVVHNELGLATSCLNFDVGNACLGFINGMQIAAAAIDAGSIDYALVVDGEGSRHTRMCSPSLPRSPLVQAPRRLCSVVSTVTRKLTGSLVASPAAGPSTMICASVTSKACGPIRTG
jgi:3-oxoacyl-[acyl-carrier-protein] synthase III